MDPVLFPFRPNWRQPVLERLEWLTDVIEARDSTEHRIALRAFPRRYLEYQLLEYGHLSGLVDAVLWGHQGKRFILPIWTDPQRLAEPLTSGATEIPAQTTGYDLHDDGLAVLWGDETTHEVVAIDTAGAETITLQEPTEQAWPKGTRLYPARVARLTPDVQLMKPTAGIVDGVLQFELQNSWFEPVPDTVLYEEIEVNERRPNRASPIGIDYQRKLHRHDYDLGVIEVDDISGAPRLLHEHEYLLESREDISDWRGWLHARAGRAHEFWQPQWQQDLIQTATIGAAATELRVRSLDYASNYQGQQGRRDIALRRRNGDIHYRRVLDSAPGDPGEEILTLDSPLGFEAAPGDFAQLTWLMRSRLDADAVEISWRTAGVAITTIPVRSLSA